MFDSPDVEFSQEGRSSLGSAKHNSLDHLQEKYQVDHQGAKAMVGQFHVFCHNPHGFHRNQTGGNCGRRTFHRPS